MSVQDSAARIAAVFARHGLEAPAIGDLIEPSFEKLAAGVEALAARVDASEAALEHAVATFSHIGDATAPRWLIGARMALRKPTEAVR